MKKKEIEQYVDKGFSTYTDVGPGFSTFDQKDRQVYGFGLMTGHHAEASVMIEAVFFDGQLYHLQPQQLLIVKNIMPNMGYIWGMIRDMDMDNTSLAFYGFMTRGTCEEFIEKVYEKHEDQLDVL